MGFFDSDIFHPGRWGDDLSNALGLGKYDPANQYRDALNQNAGAAGAFGRLGAANYGASQAGIDQSIQNLRDIQSGKNSVSALQLQQGLQQNLASQQSMAAGASPANAAMAARNAAMNMGRLGYGLSGQQAVAGQAERNAATQALGQLQLGAQQNAVSAANAGFGNANQGYGNALGTPQQTWGGLLQKGIGAVGQAAIGRFGKPGGQGGQ